MEAGITKVIKKGYFAVGCLVGLVGLTFVGQTVINSKGGDNWQVLPRPERLTELYFTDYRELPSVFTPGKAQNIAFTVHNLEYQITTYHYKLIAHSSDTNAEQEVADGVFTLQHDHSQTTCQTIVVPSLGNRVAVKVSLEYQGVAFGDSLAHKQTQSINYWAKVAFANEGGYKRV